MAIIWPGEAHIKTFSDVAIFRKCGLNTYLDHFQILAIYGENMDKTKQYSQCCAIPRYQPYMEKIWTKLNKIVSVVPFPDNGHIYGENMEDKLKNIF